MAAASTLLLDIEAEEDVNLLTGEPVVLIRYRAEGTRRWSKVVVFLDDDQTPGEVITNAEQIARTLLEGGRS